MAEKDVGERRVRIYRSVSFKKLGSWNAKDFGEEGGTDLPGKGDVTQPTCQKTHRPPARSLSLTRKVSKISAAGKEQNVSQIRRISQRFLPHPRDDGAQSDDESLRRADQLRKGGHSGSGKSVGNNDSRRLDPSGRDGLAPSPPGMPRDSFNPRESPSSGISLDDISSYCSFLHQPANKELLVAEGSNWPSVTEMRKLFGENTRKLPSRASSLPDPEGQSGAAVKAATDSQRHCSLDATANKSFNDYAKDRPSSGTLHWSKNPLENAYCRASAESKTDGRGLCTDTKDHRVINTGPKPQPPPPPPRTCIPFGLRAHTLSSGLPKQEARQQSDSLHSWHSLGKPQTAPSNVRLKDSSSEDELHRNTFSLPVPGDSTGNKVRPQEVSSGSEEDPDNDVFRDSQRKRSVRKKKKDVAYSIGNSRGHLEGDAEDDLDPGLLDFTRPKHDLRPTTNRSNTVNKSDVCPTEHSVLGLPTVAPQESPKQHFRAIPDSVMPTNPGQVATATPIPSVSRVAKVNIPPFLPSPCGSRSSSRYSSTETLKDDDHLSPYSGQGRSFQAGTTIHRSPSYGQHESLSRQLVRPRAKVPPVVSKPINENVSDGSHCEPGIDHSKNKKSLSNPDIASDTLSLLSFLKSDISDLKLKPRGQGTGHKDNICSGLETYQGASGSQTMAARYSVAGQEGKRPTLKDLTATLRRTKSFTYSDKLGSRRLNAHSSIKQSSSELMLASALDDDLEKRDKDTAAQDQYIQEARQVFEKIKQMGSQDDYSFDLEVEEHLRSSNEGKPVSGSEVSKNMAYEDQVQLRKSLNSDCSGPESSMTDEGIVTEVDSTQCSSYRDLGQTLTVWKSTGSSQEQSDSLHAHNGDFQFYSPPESLGSDKCSEVKANNQSPLDAPPTPGTMRRRRKFPSLGNGGTDSTSGSNGETGSENYRSLSDPMPHRRYSITEDSVSFSVDSNLLGSLNAKSAISDSSASALSEYTGSAASVLSCSSDGVRDYNTVIQTIVSQPGALDKVIDEKGNGKTIKKKSFSDPSRRGELTTPGLEDSAEPSKDLEQSILSSSSEPILSEQRDGLEQLEEVDEEAGKVSVEAEENGLEGNQNLTFDPNIVNVLSPRILRRSSKKRSNRIGSHEGNKEGEESPDALGQQKLANKHVRHASEPAAFIPISPPECKVLSHAPLSSSEPIKKPIKQFPVLVTPLLEEACKPTPTGAGVSNTLGVMDLPRTAPGTPTTAEPKTLKVICINK